MTKTQLAFATVCAFVLLIARTGSAQDSLKVTTWNIEHLGSEGRGFGGGYGGTGSRAIPPGPESIPLRTAEQLKDIAKFIKDGLKSDVLALQEVAINGQYRGRSTSTELKAIVAELQANDGDDWAYYLPPVAEVPKKKTNRHNEHLAFLWNRNRARLLNAFEFEVENQELAGKALFDRKPIVGYFEALKPNGKPAADFVLVNVHMASGQQNEECRLIAMTIIEFELASQLGRHNIFESDQIILGDFNDNPSLKKDSGASVFSPALYSHMKFKGYVDLVTPDLQTSRMNNDLNSLIDHVLINKGAKAHVTQDKATIYRPDTGAEPKDVLPDWRRTYSDHFPVSFQFNVTSDNDKDFFQRD